MADSKYKQMSVKDLHECKLIGCFEIQRYGKERQLKNNEEKLVIHCINILDLSGKLIKRGSLKEIEELNLLPIYKVIFK